MRFLVVTESAIEQAPHLARLLWPEGDRRLPGARYFVPEDHPNIALIACAGAAEWLAFPIESNRRVLAVV